MDEERILLTVDAAARRLGLSRAHLYPYVMSGSLPSIKIGRARRIPVAALEAWIAQKLREEAPEPIGARAEY